MNTSSRKGDFGTTKAIQWFLLNNYEVFIPFSEGTEYDLIVVKNGDMTTVQCKYTSAVRNEKNTASTFYFRPLRLKCGKEAPYDEGSVDYFFVFCSDNAAYLIPGNQCWNKTKVRLGRKYEEFKIDLRGAHG